MTKNEGTIDRTIRVIAGIAILSQAFIGLKTPFAYIGIVPILTGSIGYCPAYSIFGFSTCKIKQSNS
jgi:hypothetical protein